jgi:ATP-binding cassette, subfamily B, bacterial PglK
MKKYIFHGVTIIPDSFKKRGILIIFLLTAGSFLDLFSLASFLPVIVLVISPDRAITNKYFSNLYSLTGLEDPAYFAVALTIVALIIIFIKTQINIWITHKKASYAYSVAGDFASRAMAKYLQIPYEKFANTDYTNEMNRISNLPIVYANNYLIPLGVILAESLLLLMLLTVITAYNPMVALFILLIVVPVVFVYRAKRIKMKNLGQQIKKTYPLLLKYTLQAVEALPEIQVFKKEAFFKNRFKKIFSDLGVIFSKDHTALTGSVRLTELVATICISVLIVYALLSRQSVENSILLLSIYAGVSFRAIPSINRILAASLQIKTHEYVIAELQQMMVPLDISFEESIGNISFDKKIELADISFRHEDRPWVLKNVSLTIGRGEKVAIFGKSGSGKTTLFLVMMQFLKAQEGTIKVDDVTIDDHNSAAWKKRIGYVPQNPYILDDTLIENIAFGIPKEKIDQEKIMNLLRSLDLEAWMNKLPNKLNTIIGEKGTKLSGGQRQRLAIARALYHDAEILLLDEVTNQLDRDTEQDVINIIHNLSSLKKTVILITHRVELWKMFDSIYKIINNRLEKMHAGELESIDR